MGKWELHWAETSKNTCTVPRAVLTIGLDEAEAPGPEQGEGP